jgi:hypothetical protein
MPLAQPQLGMGNRPLRAYPAGQLLGSRVARQTRCSGEKRGLAYAALSFARILLQMLRAHIGAARARSFTTFDYALPAINRMLPRYLDHIRAEDRVERRPGNQGGENLESVATEPFRV